MTPAGIRRPPACVTEVLKDNFCSGVPLLKALS